jgi:hypothetical protein
MKPHSLCSHDDEPQSAPDQYVAPPIPQNVYPTSGQNRQRTEWTPTNPRANRKWSRTGR